MFEEGEGKEVGYERAAANRIRVEFCVCMYMC